MKRKRSGEVGSDSLTGVKINVDLEEQVKTKFFEKEGKIVLPEDFEAEMNFHHSCGSDKEEISKINKSDYRDLAVLIANSEMIPLSQAKKLVHNFC